MHLIFRNYLRSSGEQFFETDHLDDFEVSVGVDNDSVSDLHSSANSLKIGLKKNPHPKLTELAAKRNPNY